MAIILLIDTFIYTALAFGLMKLLFGNGPLGRALSVIAAIATAIGFFSWSSTPSADNMPMPMILLVFIGPIAAVIVGLFLKYVFGGKQPE